MNTAQKLLYAIGGNAAIIAAGLHTPKHPKAEKKERKVKYGEVLRAHFAAKHVKE